MFARINQHLYIGDAGAAKDANVMKQLGINVIFNLHEKIENGETMVIDYVLPSQELMDSEFQKTMNKLEKITADILICLQNKQTIFISCEDGLNKSPLVVGYFLVKKCSFNPIEVVERLTDIYKDTNETTGEKTCQKKALTMASFRKLIKLTKPTV